VRAAIAQTLPSPRKPFTAEPHHQKIGHQAGMTAIAVRERVYADKPVMKTYGAISSAARFRIQSRLLPSSSKLAQFHGY